jgi:hypothetical protein
MSMMGWVQALSSTQIGLLQAKPLLAGTLAMASELEQMHAIVAEALNRLSPEQRETTRRAFEQTPAAQEAHARRAQARAELNALGQIEPALDLDKSWHMLHYLFTGHVDASDAPGNALLAGEDIGDDVGYGPCRLHGVAATADFARFLKSLNLAQLQERVNYREMSRMQVYSMPMGPGSDAEYEGELRTEVAVYFPRLRDYVAAAAERHGGLLLWVA